MKNSFDDPFNENKEREELKDQNPTSDSFEILSDAIAGLVDKTQNKVLSGQNEIINMESICLETGLEIFKESRL